MIEVEKCVALRPRWCRRGSWVIDDQLHKKTLFTDIDVDDDNVVDADGNVVSGAIKAVLPIIEVTIRLPDIGSRTTAARTTESSLTASFFKSNFNTSSLRMVFKVKKFIGIFNKSLDEFWSFGSSLETDSSKNWSLEL